MCGSVAGRRKAELVCIDPERRFPEAPIKFSRYSRHQPKLQQPGQVVLCRDIDENFGHWDRRSLQQTRNRQWQIRSEHLVLLNGPVVITGGSEKVTETKNKKARIIAEVCVGSSAFLGPMRFPHAAFPESHSLFV